jgi:hypothetical protein
VKAIKGKVAPTSRHGGGAGRRSDGLAPRDNRNSRPLIERILDTPHLAQAVPRLPPEVLLRVIESCGLEDCAEIVALATPDQLARVFDLDVWRAGQPGLDERLDADRFGVWLEVLMESGAEAAARKLADLGVDLMIAALAQHVLVFDLAAVSPSAAEDGEEGAAPRTLDDRLTCEIGGCLVVAKRTDAWDAIRDVLISLDAEYHDCFHRVMRGCRSLSNSGHEVDGLHALLTKTEQVMFDVAFDREQRREKQGYVTPAQARAFLQMSRQLQIGHDAAPPENPVARAYFRAIEWTTAPDTVGRSSRLLSASGTPPVPEDAPGAVAAVLAVLRDAGVLTEQPRALLGGPQGHLSRLARIQAHMEFTRERDSDAYSMRTQELAYLANTVVAGCSIQARTFTAQEASDGAVAVCNLGLENWPLHWLQLKTSRGSIRVESATALPDDFLADHDLVSVFQVGWTVLHSDVCMFAADRLIKVLARLRCEDREIQTDLDALRIELARHWKAGAPWRARDALDVVAILDMPAWATLLGLIDEFPVMHAGIGASRGSRALSVSASAFEFISENSQIAWVREFMQSLPDTLRR